MTPFRQTTLAIFLVGIVSLTACQQQKPDEFKSIRQLVCDGKYADAIPKLEKYQGKHASRAGLFLGKAHLAKGDFEKAKQAFQQTATKYPKSLEAHKCRYKIALVTFLEGDHAAAKPLFQALADKPDGPLAAEATAFARSIK